MKYVSIIILFVLLGCGSNKRLSEDFQDTSKIENTRIAMIDTSRVFSINDSLKISTEITVKEYKVVTLSDTVVTYLAKEVTKKTTTEKGSNAIKNESGKSEISSLEIENKNIQFEKKEEKEPYDPDWIKYLFGVLLLVVIVSAFFYLKKYLGIFR